MRFITICVSIHLLLASLLSNSGFAGMICMGNLVSHFYHHIEEHNEDINMLEFLALHYFDQQHLQQDKHEHQNLPLKAHCMHSACSCYIPAAVPVFTFRTEEKVIIDCVRYSLYSEHFFKTPLIDIWQPPKLG